MTLTLQKPTQMLTGKRKKSRLTAAGHSEAKILIAVLLGVTLIGLIYIALLNEAQTAFANPIVLSSVSRRFVGLFKIKGTGTETPDNSKHHVTMVSNYSAELELRLSEAASPDKTVIITSLNAAWAQNNSMFELFLQSFREGNGTEHLLQNLLIVAVDSKALDFCRQIHKHCYMMNTEGIDFSTDKYYMTDGYLKMMWRRLRFFGEVLEAGYNFVFSDTDILWFRDPFTKFLRSADIQMASDLYNGHPRNLRNLPNCGYMYIRSNPRTVSFFRFWYEAQATYPGKNEQEVLNFIKAQEIPRRGLQFIFLDTKFFRGYCQKDPDLSHIYTMHANCCRGVKAKFHDLQNTLSDWRNYMMNAHSATTSRAVHWTPIQKCRQSWQ
eukprot:PITA_01199